MNRLVFFIALLFYASLSCMANKDVTSLPGYIITIHNDTLHGTISVSNWDQLTLEAQFFEEGATDGIFIIPSYVTEFGVGDKVYKSGVILIEKYSEKKSQLPETPEIAYRRDTTFLQVVVTGDKELLFLNNLGKDSFYIFDNNEYRWLVHYRYVSKNGKKREVRTNNNYIGQLIMYFNDCKSMNRILSGTTYDQKSLVQAFEHYYKCVNTDLKQIRENESSIIELSVLAGITATKISFSGTGNQHITGTTYPWSINLAGGLGTEIKIPNTLDRWSVINDIVFNSFRISASNISAVSDSSFTTTETTFGQYSIKLNTGTRTNFLVNYTNVFFDIGIYNSFIISEENIRTTRIVTSVSETTNESPGLEKMRKHNIGMFVGFGMKFNKVNGVIRYEIGTGVSGEPDVQSRMSRFSISIGYRFL